MKTRSIHLVLQLIFCTLALCASEIPAQETTQQQANYETTEANEYDGVIQEQFNQFQANDINEDDERNRDPSEHKATNAPQYDANTKEQSRYFEATEANEYDDRTLLDTFGQAAKEFLTKRVIPDTDVECKWDWRSVRCEPYCQCDFIFKGGDYHIGRSCRRRLHVEETCDPNAPNDPEAGVRYVILRTVHTSRALLQRLIQKGKSSYQRLQDRVCSHLPENLTCPDSDEDMTNVPLLAWQEKLLCRNQIPECLLKMPTPPFEPTLHARRDE